MTKDMPIGPADRLYNSRIIATYIKFLKKEYGYVNIDEVLSFAGMEGYQVEDEAHWFTQEQADAFNERVVEATRNFGIAREAGRFGFSPDSIGFVKSYILGRISIGKAYEMVALISTKFVKSCTYESSRLGPNKAKIVVRPKPGVREKLYQCQNRIGYFEAFCTLFHHKFPHVEHTKCTFRGDDCCEYMVTWQESRYEMWKRIRTFGGAALMACSGVTFFSRPDVGLMAIGGVLAALLLSSALLWRVEKRELVKGIDNLSRSTDEVVKKMETSIRNMEFARQVITALSLERGKEGMVDRITSLFEKELDYDRGMIYLANKEKTNLEFYGGFGYSQEHLDILKKTNPRLRPDSTGVFTVCFRERKSFLVNDIDEIAPDLSPRSRVFARQMGTKSFISVPIISSNITLGVLTVDNLISKRPLLQSDLDLLTGIAPEIGMAIQNTMVAEEKIRQFHSTLQVLASSIDARDPLTAGHSERVTRFAVGIAREMGLPDETVEMIRVAGLLHDYGKIGIADAILKKPGKLTNSEYNEIKTHAVKTKQILDKIGFQGIYQEVPYVACSHHERFDGTGYPLGLEGSSIPLGARILAVADVFEAITAKRHYRAPMPLGKAFQVLAQDRGKHFDPEVFDAFMRYYQKEGRIEDAAYAALEPQVGRKETAVPIAPELLEGAPGKEEPVERRARRV